MWLKAHWEVRLAAVHVEAQREEARYTVLGALSRSPAAPTTTLGPLSTPKSTENTGPLVGMGFVWVCGLKHPGNPELRFKPRFSRFLNDVTPDGEPRMSSAACAGYAGIQFFYWSYGAFCAFVGLVVCLGA